MVRRLATGCIYIYLFDDSSAYMCEQKNGKFSHTTTVVFFGKLWVALEKNQLVTASVLNDAPLPSHTYASSISFTDKIFYHFHARPSMKDCQ